jgi:Cu+-exporting ATPase
MQRITLDVKGMTCENCVKHVTEAIEGVKGVASAAVSLKEMKAEVEYESGEIGREALVEAVEEAGYSVDDEPASENKITDDAGAATEFGQSIGTEIGQSAVTEFDRSTGTGGSHATGVLDAVKGAAGPKIETITLPIEGMHCASCALTIEKTLNKKEGVSQASVNFASEKAFVRFDTERTDRQSLSEAVREAGYDVRTDTRKDVFRVEGMTCATCALTVEKALRNTDGVIDADVNLASSKAVVRYDTSVTDKAGLEAAVDRSGYQLITVAEKDDTGIDRDREKVKAARRRMVTAWALAAPTVVWMVFEMFFGIVWPSMFVFNIGITLLAIPVVFLTGWPTIRSAFKAVAHGRANMDVLIAMGTTVSFLTGPASMLFPIANFAGVSAMIMGFHLTGRYIESAAKGKASQAIKKLLELGAKTARILVGGEEKEVPVEELKIGDIMVIRPGEKVPTDGVVTEGYGAVDESMATGESMPVNRGPGDELIGATVNQEGLLKVKATKIGKDTFLAQVIKMVEECQGSKVPIQEFADRITAYFVPIILAVAGVAFLSWLIFPGALSPVTRWASSFIPWVNPELGTVTLAIFAGVSVLVIACPCALGLATPTALMVGSGIGAENGVLIRQGEAIQTLKEVRVIVFDKTGTITRGKPEVTDVIPVGGDENELLSLAASVESGSEHPIGRAVVERAARAGIELKKVTDFKAVRGKGIRGLLDGREALVGSRKFIEEAGIETGKADALIKKLEDDAKTVMLAGIGDRLMGIIGLADTLKEDSAEAVRELESMGIETAMITGDNRRTAEAIARQAGISRVLAEVLPEGKMREIKKLQETSGIVAMVGDGINDAPALTQANVGIAIGTGTDIAIEASDVTLVRGDLSGVVTAVKLSKATFRKIKQNLFWAFFYNIIAVPAAIMGLLHPVIAEAAMATSSINVVTNANLLRWVKVTPDYESVRGEE